MLLEQMGDGRPVPLQLEEELPYVGVPPNQDREQGVGREFGDHREIASPTCLAQAIATLNDRRNQRGHTLWI